jgi:hypothetical protein
VFAFCAVAKRRSQNREPEMSATFFDIMRLCAVHGNRCAVRRVAQGKAATECAVFRLSWLHRDAAQKEHHTT